MEPDKTDFAPQRLPFIIINVDISLTNIKKMFFFHNFILAGALIACPARQLEAQTLSSETILIETLYGDMKIKLFEETPLHKANFLKLVQDNFFDSLLFHRVINQFMIQGGDPLSKTAKPGDSLGHGDLPYTVPAEFNRALIHQKGRLCAARERDEINPSQASSASQFYIVMGKKRTVEDLLKYEDRINKKHLENCRRNYLSSYEGRSAETRYNRLRSESKADSALIVSRKIDEAAMREHLKTPLYHFNQSEIDTYTSMGGTPHLDGTYTVFGEVVEGIGVIDKIAAAKTDSRDRPLEDIRMKVSVVKE
jgi:cyclophilin family peptidyl-prolyl cis-trans isomerase